MTVYSPHCFVPPCFPATASGSEAGEQDKHLFGGALRVLLPDHPNAIALDACINRTFLEYTQAHGFVDSARSPCARHEPVRARAPNVRNDRFPGETLSRRSHFIRIADNFCYLATNLDSYGRNFTD